MPLPDDLIEPKAAARLLGVHLSTIHRWIRSGKLKAWRRAGCRFLVRREHVLAMVQPVEPVVIVEARTPEEIEEASRQAVEELKAAGWKIRETG